MWFNNNRGNEIIVVLKFANKVKKKVGLYIVFSAIYIISVFFLSYTLSIENLSELAEKNLIAPLFGLFVLQVTNIVTGIMAISACKNLQISCEFSREPNIEYITSKAKRLRIISIIDCILTLLVPIKLITTIIIAIVYFDFKNSELFSESEISEN